MNSIEQSSESQIDQAWDKAESIVQLDSAIQWRQYTPFFGVCAVIGCIGGIVLGLLLI